MAMLIVNIQTEESMDTFLKTMYYFVVEIH